MFITHVVVGNSVLERTVFWDLKKASKYAKEVASHKVWELGHGQVYFGDVEALVYNPKLGVTSDYNDEHILSFSDSKRNRRNVV